MRRYRELLDELIGENLGPRRCMRVYDYEQEDYDVIPIEEYDEDRHRTIYDCDELDLVTAKARFWMDQALTGSDA